MAIPRQSLSILDAIAMVVGIVIGAGIFRLPPLVASNVDGPAAFVAVWIAGGVFSLIGALCYAELAATYPNTGGDYHFLMRAFGAGPAFLFAWARLTVIQTGMIAWLAFVVGDYVGGALMHADASANTTRITSSLSAAAVVICLTALNVAGIQFGKVTQKILTTLVILALLLIAAAGAVVVLRDGPAVTHGPPKESGTVGMAMVFVLLTYSGWNEAAYLSAEMKGERRNIVVALVLGIVSVAAIYLLVNITYLAALGFEGMRASQVVAADTLRAAFGTAGAALITAMIILAALSTANATIFTGARTNYALGRDFSIFRFLGHWQERAGTPKNGLLVQGLIALALVGLGGTQKGVETMVDYTAPVFWFFFLLVGVALFVLRYKDPDAERAFRVPLYPFLPLVFCATCGYMLYASLAYTKAGALVGVGVLLAGVPVMLLARAKRDTPPSDEKVAPAAKPDITSND